MSDILTQEDKREREEKWNLTQYLRVYINCFRKNGRHFKSDLSRKDMYDSYQR